jgi:nucleoside-diphosphate-sugar epimerase
MTMALVTGAPGWLGTTLVGELVGAGRRVRCLTLPGADVTPLRGAETVTGDVTDPSSLGRLFAEGRGATVFHCAGIIHPTRGTRQLFAVNVQGTKDLLAAARQAGVRRFVHVSSNSPLGCNRRPTDVFDESAPYHPYMKYGRSKMLAELAVREAGGDLETVIIRPPWFYGPNQPARQSLFFTMIRTGKVPLVGDGENRRSMAYVDNICQGLRLAEQVPAAKGQIYWIADRRPYSMNEIITTIEEVMDRDFGVIPARKRVRLPGLASEAALAVDRVMQAAGLYHPKIHVLSEMNRTIACSVARAERELGYDPKIELREGMRRSMTWMRERGLTW